MFQIDHLSNSIASLQDTISKLEKEMKARDEGMLLLKFYLSLKFWVGAEGFILLSLDKL